MQWHNLNKKRMTRPKEYGELKKVRNWFLSFVPFIVSLVLFAVCLNLDDLLWLYLVMILCFALFVILFIRANRAVTQKDGYTTIQAIFFFLEYKKKTQSANLSESEKIALIEAIALQKDFTHNLTKSQMLKMIELGSQVVGQYENWRKHTQCTD